MNPDDLLFPEAYGSCTQIFLGEGQRLSEAQSWNKGQKHVTKGQLIPEQRQPQCCNSPIFPKFPSPS